MKTMKYIVVLLVTMMVTAACSPFVDWEFDNAGNVKVKVQGIYVTVNGVTDDQIVLEPNKTFVIDIKVIPEDADNPNYVISVDNEDIITIEGNVIKAIGIGEVTVTIASEELPSINRTITIIVPNGFFWVGDESKAVDQSLAESRQR